MIIFIILIFKVKRCIDFSNFYENGVCVGRQPDNEEDNDNSWKSDKRTFQSTNYLEGNKRGKVTAVFDDTDDEDYDNEGNGKREVVLVKGDSVNFHSISAHNPSQVFNFE